MYWTLDTRPPTLDERILQAKARHAERVEQIAAEEPVPQLEVPDAHSVQAPYSIPYLNDLAQAFSQGNALRIMQEQALAAAQRSMTLPGRFVEVPAAKDVRDVYRQMAAQQNVGMSGLPRFGLNDQPLTSAVHTFQMDAQGTRIIHSRGPFYHPPISLGTLTEYH